MPTLREEEDLGWTRMAIERITFQRKRLRDCNTGGLNRTAVELRNDASSRAEKGFPTNNIDHSLSSEPAPNRLMVTNACDGR